MKYLFLDFDGVLHPTTHGSTLFSQMPLLESSLKDLHRDEFQIVISSSWRFHMPLDELMILFPETLQKLIVGVTGDAYIGKYPRYIEICGYLTDVGSLNNDWRALDDAYLEFPTNCDQLIRCHPNHGFTKTESDLLHKWLWPIQ